LVVAIRRLLWTVRTKHRPLARCTHHWNMWYLVDYLYILYRSSVLQHLLVVCTCKRTANVSKTLSVRRLALLRLFFSIFFGWSIFCNPFSHLHSFAYPISHTLDLFKLHTNTSNCLNISLNFLLYTLLLFCNTL